MTQEVLNEILAKHELWYKGKKEGERANLQCADLQYANLEGANLEGADLEGADLRNAKLEGADLRNANLRNANLRNAKLEGADLRNANLRYANLRYANLRNANLRNAKLEGADIDYSAWVLWCGSLKAHVDDRIAVQLLYHALSVVQYSPYVSEDIKRTLLTPEVVEVANRFHRVDECGKLEIFNGGEDE